MKWNWKRVAGMFASMIGFAALVSLAVAHPKAAAWIMSACFTAAVFLLIYLIWRPLKTPKIIITAAMITSLVGVSVQSPAQTPPPPQEEEQLWGACIIALAVVGIGVYITFKLKKLCDHCLKPKDPPPQPPPANTNRVSRLVGDSPINLSIDVDNLTLYDVSTNVFVNQDPDGWNYVRWFSGTLQSSTNMLAWVREASFNLWASAGWQTVVWYDRNGAPVSTNTARLNEQSQGSVPVLADAPNKFFRVIQ